MIEVPFAETGSILITGYEMNFQSIVVQALALETLHAGGGVVYLADHQSEASEITASMTDALRALDAEKSTLERFSVVTDVRQLRTSEELVGAIGRKKARLKYRPLLIVRDLGRHMLQLTPGASWLSQAEEVALLLDTRVLTAAHHGPSGPPAPDYLKFKADEVWTCAAGLNLAVTLKRIKPTDAIVHLRGKVAEFGQFVFENEDGREFANV